MNVKPLLALALLLAGCAVPLASHTAAPRAIGASGIGRVMVRPDTALVHVGAEARAPALADATADVDRRMREVLARVKALGIADADIATVEYAIEPLVAQRRAEDDPARVAGYRVANVVQVRVRDLGAVGRVLDSAVAGGANTLPSLQVIVADRTAPEAQARALAVREAAAKAAQMATAAGVTLGKLLSLSEGGGVRPVERGGARVMSLGAPGPVEAGLMEIAVTVDAQYGIAR